MQASNSPDRIQLPFANSGTKNTIPVPSQIGITPGAASFTDGFPPLTFTPLSAGGIPPAGADFNGIFNAITAILRWQCAGGFFKYSGAFATAIGGYPAGAVLLNATDDGLWLCLADNNMSDPDSGGADWTLIALKGIQGPQGMQTFTATGAFSFTVPDNVWKIRYRVQGAGGGGGSVTQTSSAASGGSSGAYAEGIMSVTPGQVITGSIGAGGAGGAAGGDGDPGGDTTFSTITAGGGLGGLGSTAVDTIMQPSLGGTATGGTINVPGSPGQAGFPSALASSPFGGNGASSQFGAGGPEKVGDGNPGTGYGSGGSGGCQIGVGGAGAGGIVAVDW